ncbi:CsiV family protein [Kaarinaea lacus]
MKIQYVSVLAGALFLSQSASQNVLAANTDENDIPWYQVEVVIFANQSYLGMSSETWPENSELQYDELVELVHPEDAKLNDPARQSKLPNFNPDANPAMPVPFQLLDSSELQLVPVAKKLSASQDYQVIMHIAWRQPTVDPDKAIPVYVFEGVDLSASAQMKAARQAQKSAQQGGSRFTSVAVGDFTYDSSQYGQLLPVTEVDINTGPVMNPFSGTLKLGVSRYLHLAADLNYRVPILKEEVVPVDPMATGFDNRFGMQQPALLQTGEQPQTTTRKRQVLQTFHMFETRRMRSKEIHYFDHPMFGLITRVIPYEIPKVEPDFDPASQAFTPGSGAPKTSP